MDTYSHLLDDVDDDEIGGLDEAFGKSLPGVQNFEC